MKTLHLKLSTKILSLFTWFSRKKSLKVQGGDKLNEFEVPTVF